MLLWTEFNPAADLGSKLPIWAILTKGQQETHNNASKLLHLSKRSADELLDVSSSSTVERKDEAVMFWVFGCVVSKISSD